MLLTHLCSDIIDLAAKTLITLKTEAPVAITPAPLLFQCVGKTVIMYLAAPPFSFRSSLFPCFLSNLRFLSWIHFSQKKEARIKRGDACACFIIRKERNRKTRHGLIFSTDRLGKATSVQRLCTQRPSLIFLTFKEHINDNNDATQRRLRRR